ncbi:hypothetical protein BV25DRAFT_1792211 [Artomyces pyxidatus]|uniref:Uncharacterized protein n=1 Tax=Artomyces pyxidatus TaxID=48021 RepID=A0ACB8TKH2_9AGAM|nr:hypothetical protein BV25DRAFT_1792211 [Artomyces pyxidatus]
MAPVLLSRSLDPVLGLFTGVLAYYLSETNPRTALPPEERLDSLIRWKMEKTRRLRAEQALEKEADTVDWKQVVGETETK